MGRWPASLWDKAPGAKELVEKWTKTIAEGQLQVLATRTTLGPTGYSPAGCR